MQRSRLGGACLCLSRCMAGWHLAPARLGLAPWLSRSTAAGTCHDYGGICPLQMPLILPLRMIAAHDAAAGSDTSRIAFGSAAMKQCAAMLVLGLLQQDALSKVANPSQQCSGYMSAAGMILNMLKETAMLQRLHSKIRINPTAANQHARSPPPGRSEARTRALIRKQQLRATLGPCRSPCRSGHDLLPFPGRARRPQENVRPGQAACPRALAGI